MPRLIKAKIDVKKINKDRLFKGEKGTYLDITLIETPNGKYGEWMIVQDAPKDEKGTILGNGKNKNWGSDSGGGSGQSNSSSGGVSTDDLPI